MRHLDRRAVLLAQHKRLRELIVDVGDAATNVLESSDAGIQPHAADLTNAVRIFVEELRLHLASEEELLGPVLERLDAWGPERLEILRLEHAHQRAVLQALRNDWTLGPREMARRARSLVADVAMDMEAEERDLLSEALLRDDPIVLDQSGS